MRCRASVQFRSCLPAARTSVGRINQGFKVPNVTFKQNVFVRRCGGARSGAGAPALAAAESDSKVADFTLANGLELVVIPDHRAPVVTHMIWYKVGAADETPGKSGLAHFLEHLMFKGTAKHPAGQFSQVVARMRRPGERLHLQRLHRLFTSACRATSSRP